MLLEQRFKKFKTTLPLLATNHIEMSLKSRFGCQQNGRLRRRAAATEFGLTTFWRKQTQELCRKAKVFPALDGTFIGSLQTNKLRCFTSVVVSIHGRIIWLKIQKEPKDGLIRVSLKSMLPMKPVKRVRFDGSASLYSNSGSVSMLEVSV
jgi:hypothetical protein